jgi:YbgC/YbaW family acyl-CoA thioester hydrolase
MAPFVYRRRVQFAETDLVGMVHFSWYYRYMEEAEHALWRAAGLRIADPDSDVRFPRVATSCDFRAPLHFEDEFEVRIHIASIGARSIRYECEMVRGETEVATGTMTVACVRIGATGGRAVDLPEEIATRLKG